MSSFSQSTMEPAEEVFPPELPTGEVKADSILKRAFKKAGRMLDWVFGFVSIIAGVALLSVVPILNFLSFGYLLEVSGRIAKSGRLRDGFIGVRKASVFASAALGIWLTLFPMRFVASMWRDAELMSGGTPVAEGWRIGLMVITLFTAWHICWALIRGGRLRHFFWPAPIRFMRWLNESHNPREQGSKVIDFIRSLNFPHYFQLGAKAFVGALAFLVLPVGILIFAGSLPPGGGAFFSLVGAALLVPAVLYLPFLQARFAVDGQFKTLFEVKKVRALFRRAPIAFWTALLVTLLFALPLYLLKIELPPKELTWLISLLFVAFILPARMLTGWAVGRALRRESERHFLFRWSSRLASIPVAGIYILFLYLTQYLSWNGSLSLLEQHAFMVPTPLLGL